MQYDILVNKENEIDMALYNNVILPSLIEVPFERDNKEVLIAQGNYSNKIYLETETKTKWLELRNHVRDSKNVDFDICNGFLTIEQQQFKYDDFLNRNGIELTEKRMALPGYSEHHTGLAIDCDYFYNGDWAGITPDEDGKENDITLWIHNELHNYGFILRYPKGKEDITNMSYEPWHIRYVGLELANYMSDNDLTLEEYNQLRKSK